MGWSVIGQERAVATLRHGLATDRLAHAYLLSGPPHVGKGRLALDLAKAVNCLGAEPPCGACRPCRLIEAGQHADVETVSIGGLCDTSDHDHKRDGSKDIKICQIRRLERILALRPFEGRNRVIIIDPADALNIFAADALLKTLEEPPDDVKILLIACDAESLPETVVSRMRRLSLCPVPIVRISEELVQRGVEPGLAKLLAGLSLGRMGWALGHAADSELLKTREQHLEQVEALLTASRAERMSMSSRLAAVFSSSRDALYLELDLWQNWWRDLLLLAEGCEDLVANSDRLVALRTISQLISATGAVQALEALRSCRMQLEDNANARLALEVLLLRLPGPVKREEVGPAWATLR